MPVPASSLFAGVKNEIDFSLKVVKNALLQTQREGVPAKDLRLCPYQLHQVNGALRMLSLDGAAQFCRAIEEVLESLIGPEIPPARTVGLAERAVTALQEFTDAVAGGGANVPHRLFPLYRELAAAREKHNVSERDLFFPDLSLATPEHPEKQSLAQDAIARHALAQRARFQRGLVAWMHKPDDPRGLHEMAQSVDALDRVSGELAEPRALWWIAGAVIEALLHPPSAQWLAAARPICSKIDFQMRDLAKGNKGLGAELARDMLYVVATCPAEGERIRAVKERYALGVLLPEPDVSLEFDMEWLEPALADMRSGLEAAKGSWLEYLSGEPQRLPRFRQLVKGLKARADELGNHQLVRLLDVIVLVSTRLREPCPRGSELVTMEMATAFLLAESIIDSFVKPPADLEQQVVLVNGWLLDAATGKAGAAPPPGLRSDLIPQLNRAHLHAQVAREIIVNLQQIEEVIDGYARDDSKRETLTPLSASLRQVDGALKVLGYPEASALLERCGDMIAACGAPHGVRPRQDLDWIAEGLSSLSFFLEPCLHGKPPESAVIASFMTRLAARHTSHPQSTPAAAAASEQAREPPPASGPEPEETTAQLGEEIAPHDPPVQRAQLAPAPSPFEAAKPYVPAAQPADAAFPEPPVADLVRDELMAVYLEETDEVLATLAATLPRCRERADDRVALTVIRRSFHTIKGSGRMVGLHDLGEIAWAIEQVMNRWLDLASPATPELLELVENATSAFAAWVAMLKARQPLVLQADDLLARAARLKCEAEESGDAMQAVVREVAPVEAPEIPQALPAPCVEVAPIAAIAPPAAMEPPTPAPARPEALIAPPPAAEVAVGNVRVSATLYEIYVKEARQHVNTLAAEAAAWRAQPGSGPSPDWSRAAHTLAGISRTAGLAAIAELAGAIESWLAQAHHTSSPEDAELVQAAIAALGEMVASVAQRMEPAPAEALVAALHALASRPPPPAPSAMLEAAVVRAAASAGQEKRVIRDDLDPQLLPLFLDEAAELLPAVGSDLRHWKSRPADRNVALSLKRSLHTLKGSARMAGAMRLGELTHLMEAQVEAAENAGGPTPDLVAELEAQMDRLSTGVDRLRAGPAPSGEEHNGATDAPAPVAERLAASAAMLRIGADTLDRLIGEAGEASIARSRIEGELRGLKQSLNELNDSVMRLRAQLREMELQADSQLQSRLSELEEARADFDPLEFDRYTRLQELARMMGETMHDIMSIQQTLMRAAGETDVALLHQGRIHRELQQKLMRLRTVPFSSLTERLHRVVRQAAREAGKKANLEIRGDQAELDRSVLERIAAPLEHLLRNALAHGIEPPEQRIARGKQEIGEIALSARQENDAVIIVVQDDGAGLDLDKLRRRGAEQGLLAAGAQPTAAELAQLIFSPGLSTADGVSELAGRGVGMDVVRREIAAAGGRIDVDTTSGAGATFTIRLPLTLAVAQAVLVRAGEPLYAVPSAMVHQVLRVKPPELATLYAHGAVEAHGQRYPLHYLGHLLGTQTARGETEDYSTVLLLVSGNQRAALHVDELVKSQEIVIKSVGPQLARIRWIAGATVLGDGRIVLIVNALQLAQNAQAAVQASPMVPPPVPAPRTQAARTVMVVDDSLTVRKITSRLLEREGYRVLAAKDGLDALEQISHAMPDIMLVDIEMPRMDGFDLTRNLRGDPRTASVPIIVISSRTADKHRAHAFELGVNDFIGKPYQEAELLAHIQRHLAPESRIVH